MCYKASPILGSQRKHLQNRFTGAQVVVIFEHCANEQAPPGAARNRLRLASQSLGPWSLFPSAAALAFSCAS